MLFNTLKTYNYLVDYYSYTLVTSADGTVTTKQYVTVPANYAVAISTSFIGDIVVLSDKKMQIDGYLKNLRDRNGNEVYPDGVWQIRQTQPVLNALGIAEGYKYKAKIIDGND
jgi:hypothetical protein